MQTTLKNIDKFYHTPWIYIVSLSFIWIVSILGILPFALNPQGTMEWGWGNREIIRGNSNAWIGWVILAISFIGGTFAVIGEISISNNSRKYVVPITIGRILITTWSVLMQVWFLALTCFIYVVIGIINRNKWDDMGNHLINKMTLNNHIITIFATIAFITLGLGITLGENSLIYDPYPILDVLVAALTIIGWLNISQKNKWGWLVFAISDVGNIIIYLLMSSMPLFAGSTIYFIFDSIAAFRWFNWEYAHYNLADSLIEKYL